MFASESWGENSPLGFGISLLWIEAECHSGEKAPPILAAVARAPNRHSQNGRGGFLHKERSDAAAHVLEGELENMATSGEHSCVTQTCACDVFLERWAKKASSQEHDRNKSHELLIRWGLTLLCLLTLTLTPAGR